jgi:predicted DsbA family dithiol-disulfide isomerase
MNDNECTVGTRVGLISKTFPCSKGKIVGSVEQVGAHNTVIVEWDNKQIQRITTRSLLSEKDALTQDQTLKEEALRAKAERVRAEARAKKERLRLEQEFEQSRELIASKFVEAAKLVEEADKLARKAGKSLYELDEAQPLIDAMEEAGWDTSSISC